MSDTFPFGNDPRRVLSWLGRRDTPSRRWSVSYNAGLTFLCGKHTMIFFGHDNLQIGVVEIQGCGPTVSRGTGDMRRGRGAGGQIPDRQIERAIEGTEDAINNSDYFADVRNVEDADSGRALLALMNNNPSQFDTNIPMSFSDLSRAWGTITGFNVDIMVAGAQIYYITISPTMFAWNAEQLYVADQQVYNLDDGSVGIGAGILEGKWVVRRTYDLWEENTQAAFAELGVSAWPAETPDIQPNGNVPNQIHPFLRQLPMRSYPVPEALIRRYFHELETTD